MFVMLCTSNAVGLLLRFTNTCSKNPILFFLFFSAFFSPFCNVNGLNLNNNTCFKASCSLCTSTAHSSRKKSGRESAVRAGAGLANENILEKLELFHDMEVLFPEYFLVISRIFRHTMALDTPIEIGFSNLSVL